jgi:hypothetical protein
MIPSPLFSSSPNGHPGGGTQRLLLYHDGEGFAMVFLSKDTPVFSLRLWRRRD